MGDDVVELDVGGKRFKTRVKTLTNASTFFAALLSNRWRPESNRAIFLDRDPVGFGHVLNLLRDPSYPFPHATHRHELAFYGVRVATSEEVGVEEGELPVADRSHPESWPAGRGQSLVTGQLYQLVSQGHRNECLREGWVVDRPVQLRGPSKEKNGPDRGPGPRRLTGNANMKARTAFRDQAEPESRWRVVNTDLHRDGDGWSDLELQIRYRARGDAELPAGRWEFFRRDLLSLLIRRVQIASADARGAQEPAVVRRLVAEIRSETLTALQLIEDAAHNPSVGCFPVDDSRLPSMLDVVFSESRREVRVSLAPLFALLFRASCGESSVLPRTLLNTAVLRVKVAHDDPACPVILESCRITAQRHLYDIEDRELIFSVGGPDPAVEPAPRYLSYLNWIQQRALVPKGATVVSRDCSLEQIAHEMLIFARLVREESDQLPCPRFVRLKRVRGWFNDALGWDWAERELLEHMADSGWTVRVPIYRACWSGYESDWHRVPGGFRVEAEFWEPVEADAELFFAVRRENLMDQKDGEPMVSLFEERVFTV